MSTLLLTATRINLWHFVWIAVVLSILLSLLLNQLIHGRIVWEYPFAATFIAFTVAAPLIYLIKRLGNLQQVLAEQAGHRVEDVIGRRQAEDALRESQERFSRAFKDAAIGMALVGTDGQWLQVNPALCALVGYTEQELLATTFQAITHPDDLDADLAFVRQMLAGEIPTYHMEKRYFHKQGHIVWILLTGSLVRDPVSNPLYFIAQIQDITERKQVEEALRKSEARYRQLIELSPDAIYVLDDRGTFTLTNPAGCALLGYTEQELVGMSVVHTYRAEERPTVAERLQQLKMGRPLRFERVAVRKNGTTVPIEVCLSPMTHRHYQAVARDITGRKRVEDELLALKDDLATELMAMSRLHEFSTRLVASTELQPLLAEVLNATIALQDADFGNIQLYNPHTQALEIVAHRGFQQDFLEYFSSVHDSRSACGRALQQQERVIIEDVHTDPRFEPHRSIAAAAGFCAVQSTPLFSRSGELLGMISTHFRRAHRPSERELRLTDLYARQAAEMIERKRVDEEIRASEGRLRAFMDNSPAAVFIKDQDGRYVYINRTLERRFETTAAHWIGKTDSELWPKAVAERLRANDLFVLSQGPSSLALEVVESVPDSTGSDSYWLSCKFPLHNSVGPSLLGGIAMDITKSRHTEEALRTSEQRLRQALDDRERLSQDLHDHVIQSIYAIGMALESCHYLIESDPGLAARRLQRSIADLNGVMKEVRNYIEWASPTLTSSDQLSEALEDLVRSIPSARPLAIRLEIDPSTGGQLTAEEATHVLQIAREAVSNSLRHSGAKTGAVSLCKTDGGLRLEVRDDGGGFDTKSGEGHGLGLHNMAARANKLDATLKVLSERGRGTQIILDIPKVHNHASEPSAIDPAAAR